MLIHAAVRPRGLKRGMTDKKLGKSLGFDEAVGLQDVCGRLELSATKQSEFFFLKELYRAVTPLSGNKSTRIIIEIDGENVATYSYEAPIEGESNGGRKDAEED